MQHRTKVNLYLIYFLRRSMITPSYPADDLHPCIYLFPLIIFQMEVTQLKERHLH